MSRSTRPRLALCMPPGAQSDMDPWRAISPPMRRMDSLDLGQQSAIGRLARTFGPIAPCVIPRRRDGHHIAHEANWRSIAPIFDETEFHSGAFGKMRGVFLESRAPCANAHSRAATGRFPWPNPYRHCGAARGGLGARAR